MGKQKQTKKQTNGRLIEKEDEYCLPLTHSNLTAQDDSVQSEYCRYILATYLQPKKYFNTHTHGIDRS